MITHFDVVVACICSELGCIRMTTFLFLLTSLKTRTLRAYKLLGSITRRLIRHVPISFPMRNRSEGAILLFDIPKRLVGRNPKVCKT